MILTMMGNQVKSFQSTLKYYQQYESYSCVLSMKSMKTDVYICSSYRSRVCCCVCESV